MISVIKIFLLATIIACYFACILGQSPAEPELFHGKTIDKVVVAADNSQSYALIFLMLTIRQKIPNTLLL